MALLGRRQGAVSNKRYDTFFLFPFNSMHTLETIAEQCDLPVSQTGHMFGHEPTVFVGDFHADPIAGRGIDLQVPGANEGHYGIRYIGGMSKHDAMIVHESCKQAAKETFDHLQRLGVMDMPWQNIVAVGDETNRTVIRCLEDPRVLRALPDCIRNAHSMTPFALTPSVQKIARSMNLSLSRDIAATEQTGNKATALHALRHAPVSEGFSVFSEDEALRSFRELKQGGGTAAMKVGRASSGFGIFFADTEEEFADILRIDKVRIALSRDSNVLESQLLNLTPNNAIGARVERWIGTGDNEEEVLCSMGIVLNVTRDNCEMICASEQILHPGEEDGRFDASHEGNLSPVRHIPDDIRGIILPTVEWLRSIESFGVTGIDLVVSRSQSSVRGRIVELNARPTASMAGAEVAKKMGLKAWEAKNIAVPKNIPLASFAAAMKKKDLLMEDGENGLLVLNHATAFGGKSMVMAAGQDREHLDDLMNRLDAVSFS